MTRTTRHARLAPAHPASEATRDRLHPGLRTAAFAVALAVPLLAAGPAFAHGLGTDNPNRPLGEYLWLGFKHLLLGWDHLLFILGVCLLAGTALRASKLISLFVAGHSITLLLGAANEWRVDPELVDVVVAMAVLVVGVLGVRRDPLDWVVFGAALFAFGLLHGLGLATRLQDLGVSDDNLVFRILLFNIGIELGQAVAVATIVFAVIPLLKRLADGTTPRWVYGAIATAGGVGAMIVSFPGGERSSQAKEIGSCTQADAPDPGRINARHPAKRFYLPREQTPERNFGHVLKDNLVVIRYAPQTPVAAVRGLRRQVLANPYVVAGPATTATPALVARTAGQQLTCRRIDLPALSTFTEDWLSNFQKPAGAP